MLSITLAYATDNQRTAHRLAGDLESHVAFTHVPVGKANEGPLLIELLQDTDQPIVLLVSDNFLKSPNCMLNTHDLYGGQREVLPVFIRSHQYDELADEVITTQTSLNNQAEVMHYVNHWQDRYIDLRTQSEELTISGGESFQNYLRKIREASTQAEELLYLIKDKWSLTEEQFAGNHYHQLFLFAERPQLWEDFKSFEETPVDVSGIPGLAMLGTEIVTPDEDAPAAEQPEEAGADAGAESELLRSAEEETLPSEPTSAVEELVEDLVPPEPPAEETDNTIFVENEEPPTVVPEATPEPEVQAATWVERAWALFDGGEAAAGLELLASGREALPDHPSLHYNYALLLVTATEDVSAGQAQLEALLDKYPDHPEALFLNGELAEAAGEIQRARDNWEQLSDTEPFHPDLNFRLGTLIDDHFPEDYLDAAAYLRRATKETNASGEAFYRYGRILAGPIERKKKAIKQLRRAVELSPNHGAAHHLLGQLLFSRGEVDAAQNFFRIASGIDPQFQSMDNQTIFADPPVEPIAKASAADALAALKADIAALEQELAAQQPEPAPAAAPKKGTGKTVLISGATSGIGRATARRLAADGYRLILLGRRQERLESLSNELKDEHGTDTHLIQVDVRHREEVKMAIANLPTNWQSIDVLLNNAGKAKGFDPIHTGDYEHWDEMIDVNLKGLLTLTREVSPLMVARQTGTIINVASTAGKEVYPNGNVYCATKHAVDALTYAMRIDLVKHGIRVGQICPAHVEETEFAVVRFDGDKERAKIYEDFQPLRSPDVAEAIHFMISQPRHVNIMDIVLQGTQQASSTVVDRSGRAKFAPEEE